MQPTFEKGFIDIKDATQNNLQHVNLRVPKYQTTVFVGLSGSGKSSLVFDTIAAASRRELNETFPSFTQQYLPKYGQPHVGDIEHLPVAIVIEQQRLGKNARSTLATYTGIYSLMRLLFSRIGKPFIGYSDTFSFNLPQGMCPDCQGLGYVDDIDESKLIDPEKSLNQGAITFVSFGPDTWRWRRYATSGLFDDNKPIKDYTPEEYEMLMHAPQQKLAHPGDGFPRTALYEGVVPRIRRSVIGKKEAEHHREAIAEIVTRKPCPTCHGTRLRAAVLTNHINGKNIADVTAMDLNHVLAFLRGITEPLATDVVRELTTKIQSLVDIGLGYLTLDRGTSSLSGGEAQRIKIAKYLTSALVDMVYILDEPSVGLHPHDIQLVKQALTQLKDKGNTILVVEHNPAMIDFADYVVEMGPLAGQGGGTVTFTGTYPELLASDSLTGKWLRQPHHWGAERQPTGTLPLRHVTQNNLKDVDVDVPLGVMTVISGVAGSGKSSLVTALKGQLKDDYIDLAQAPVGINIRSTPATYLGILDEIRKLFSNANNRVGTSLFSYNGKGACPRCKGKGVTITNMAFMDPVVQTCELCHGKRYSDEALQYTYQGKNIAEVLQLSVKVAKDFFAATPKLASQLGNLDRVGLGYLTLAQPLTTLSGGELQRLKLAVELGKQGTVYLLDEPTAGLHLQDTDRLLKLFNALVAAGNSLIIIEHNLAVIGQADWLIDVGPDAGRYGGQIQYSGTPREAVKVDQSRTGVALRAWIAEN
ncbi:MAG: excinuclease ABC subunit UvrA [Levilactobacillus sp.]|jgi:excinuclease UvrABC ATPase subunit|uniref:excinuclease ABC subunit UvrA n=1 Tax=Levilactobacillus sp. TaxID=2767919 RepID=UPI00258B891F|nr:excinuclease ABC subunit UvrA [Levilactobacillus sp.]MCI1553435.1 excinuclease ABC subunit UvrA [Levilactobacillus sp.]MCI1597824.1 excinuclease ABC subunit UvrA [Levilactobacillus sp.]MCI1605568.1 excinuclease ABC subunit UvrA [Levilactobacillus sp.]